MSDPARIMLPLDEGLTELPEGPVLFIRPSAGIPQELAAREGFVCEQGFRPVADRLEARGFTVVPVAEGRFAGAMVELTRNRAENMANVARALRLVAPDGVVLVSGNKTDGVDSLLKAVRKVTDISGVLSKSHGKVFWLSGAVPVAFADWEAAAGPKRNPAGYLTAPGMFSPEKIDTGSEMLARYFDKSVKGTVADLGAGWGYLAQQALATCDKIGTLDLYEAEYSALEAARSNVTDPRARFHWADVATLGKPATPCQTVISNPPFHQSRAAEPSIGIGFIAAAARLLKPSGQFLMVANRQLPYETALEAHFKHWEILEQDRAFKVIRARRPKTVR